MLLNDTLLNTSIDINTALQYSAVLLLIIFAVWKILRGVHQRNKNKKKGSCYGCSLAGSCRDFKTSDGRKQRQESSPTGMHSPEADSAKRDCHK